MAVSAEPALVTLRAPDADASAGDVPVLRVEAGSEARLTALIRNQSDIVDNYDLAVTRASSRSCSCS